MATRIEVQREAESLAAEDQAALAAYLLSTLSSSPLGPNDDEADQRDFEMDSGKVIPISHPEFLRQVGRA